MEKVFGICLLGTDGNNAVGLESTDVDRRANGVTLAVQDPSSEYAPAIWRFVPESKRSIIYQYCFYNVNSMTTSI